MDALHNGAHHYGPAAGTPEFRKAIAADIAKRRGIKVIQPGCGNPGAKPIIFYSILALVDTDDEVFYPNQGFPSMNR